MLHRRAFIGQLAGGASALLLSGCGGGGSETGGEVSTAAPVPTGAPPASAPVAASAASDGYTIDVAETELTAPFAKLFQGFSASEKFDAVITVTNANALAAALAAASSTANNSIAIQQKVQIVCDWSGPSILSAGPAAILRADGFVGRTDGHLDHGGGIHVVRAAGRRPALANQVNMNGTRGIHFDGIGFFRQVVGNERAETAYGAYMASNSTFPAKPVVVFTNCDFGARVADASLPNSHWVGAIATAGLPEYVGLFTCRFNGHQTIAKLAVRHCRIDLCDFQANIQDAITLFGHTVDSGYYAYAWVSRCTFRNVADELGNRSAHIDAIQTGTERDRHLGYRCLFTDLVVHTNHSYAGEPGQGGGTQGFYNDDHLSADNQFVLRRCITLVGAPHGFSYYSPNASKRSFVDQCTFMRCGRVPSSFSGDVHPAQDFPVGITGSAPPGGPWLVVTRTIGLDLRSNKSEGSQVSILSVDPRNRSDIPAGQRPEAVFKGRDFTRGGAAANGMVGKFGYILPLEGGTQAQFVADVWANFEPAAGFNGIGSPDPRAVGWLF